ncbi:MAG TPA: hypothetical protein VMP01_28255 [Pirellulaceae bacterium]|nr:hypothetical protein [Pirellulaceae bacterium]
MRTANGFRCLVALVVLSAAVERCVAEEPKTPSKEELIKNLEKTLTGAKLTGRFTVTGKDDMAPAPEEYTITSARKLIDGDQWMITARIKYGKTDKSFPVPIDIQWAGTTPIMTLDKVTIPGLGTFSTRVVIHEGLYAGTWQHDAVGGHLFGTISRAEEKASQENNEEKSK